MYDLSSFSKSGSQEELVVLLHGYSGPDRFREVRDALHQTIPNADIYAPNLPYSTSMWQICTVEAQVIVAELLEAIDHLISERLKTNRNYKSIIFVGHSFGAVIARRLVIAAFGEQYGENGVRPAPFETELARFARPRPWARLIQRVVLLAGVNRGWSVSSAMDWTTSVWWSALQFLAETVLKGKPTILAIRRGAPFLVQTRLQWLALMDPEYGQTPSLLTIQLLGTIDDVVTADDSVDYYVDLISDTADPTYFYIEVPYSSHLSIIEMGPNGPPNLQRVRAQRRQCFVAALVDSVEDLQSRSVKREAIADILPPPPDSSVTDVVFVIHGIRDKGFWTQKIARVVKQEAEGAVFPCARKVRSLTESYGYFPILPFMIRSVRQRKVEWLMDRYTEARVRYPRAVFHYVGHSNGTYLVAQALQDYPAASFGNIVFAGSVVRRDYDWLSLINRKSPKDHPRVTKVLNYVAADDWVVASFPKAVQQWRSFSIGSAGHDGFDQSSPCGPIYDIGYIKGGHSSGHQEPTWRDTAKFILSGKPPLQKYPPFEEKQDSFVRLVGITSPFLVPLIATGAILVGICIFNSIFQGQVAGYVAALRAMGFVLYVWAISLIITKF